MDNEPNFGNLQVCLNNVKPKRAQQPHSLTTSNFDDLMQTMMDYGSKGDAQDWEHGVLKTSHYRRNGKQY